MVIHGRLVEENLLDKRNDDPTTRSLKSQKSNSDLAAGRRIPLPGISFTRKVNFNIGLEESI